MVAVIDAPVSLDLSDLKTGLAPAPSSAPSAAATKTTTTGTGDIYGRRCPTGQSVGFWDLARYSDYVVPCISNSDCVDYESQYRDVWGFACCS
jgi:hypothetical protein